MDNKSQDLENEVKIREKTEQSMKRMVAQYSHALGNTLFPERLLNLANQLKTHKDFHKLSLELRKAYQAEVFVKHEADLMIAQHGSDGGQNFRRSILKDRLEENSLEKTVSVMNILDDAAEKVIGRLLNQNDVKLELARGQLIKRNGTELEKITSDFEERVLIKNELKPLQWIDTKLAKTTIGELSSLWKKVRLRKNGCAHALLQGHWAELIFNALKYSDHSKNKFIKLSFEEHSDKNYTWLRMVWENPCIEKDKKIVGEGLGGIFETLSKLNKTEDKNLTLNFEFKKNHFCISLFYRSDMLILTQS